MHQFQLAEPSSLKQVIALLAAAQDGICPIAGGTAVMLMMKAGVFQPQQLISLGKIEPQYSAIEIAGDGALHIGAMARLRQLELSAEVATAAPVIGKTMRRLANVRVRNVATLGGHLAHGDPHLDLPPVLIALGADVVIAGPGGERTIAVEDLFESYLQTSLANSELIAKVIVPPQGGRRSAYTKHTTRSADDWPALGIAVSLALDGDAIASARVAIGAATDTPRRLVSVEKALSGKRLDDALMQSAGAAAAREAEVHSDARGSAAYKRELVRIVTVRTIAKALQRGL